MNQLADLTAYNSLILIWYICEKVVDMSSNLMLMMYALCHSSVLRWHWWRLLTCQSLYNEFNEDVYSSLKIYWLIIMHWECYLYKICKLIH